VLTYGLLYTGLSIGAWHLLKRRMVPDAVAAQKSEPVRRVDWSGRG
jgi:hypothetical protein